MGVVECASLASLFMYQTPALVREAHGQEVDPSCHGPDMLTTEIGKCM
jgi:hypothetical protein